MDKYIMNPLRIFLLLILVIILFSRCEETTKPDTTPPTVTITSPLSGSIVSEIVDITCISTDNEGVEKVELWIDGASTGLTDNTEPYSFLWNTTDYENSSTHTISVRAYDLSENKTDSDPITLVVDNRLSVPQSVSITKILFEEGGFNIRWSPSPDSDFSSYELYESFINNMSSMSLIYQSNMRTDTNFTVTGIVEDERRYYQVVVTDAFGLKSASLITEGSSYRTIVFRSNRDGNSEIYFMDIGGSNPTNLTNTSEQEGEPQFSPDGTKILFQSSRDGNEEIYIMNVDGSSQTNLTQNSGDDYLAQFSPDGTKILFFSRRNDEMDVYLMNIDGTDQANLSQSGESMDVPRDFSPYGTEIIFESTRDGNREVYIMNIDGSNQINLINNSATDIDPQFSPDGSKIAFTSDRDGNYEVYIMNVDGSNQIRLTNNSGGDSRPRFSPDGSMIAFRSDRNGNLEIYIMNVDGSNQTNLSNSSIETDYGHQFTPDGLRIVFVSARDGNNEIYIMHVDGSNQSNLSNNSATDSEPNILPFPH